MSRAEHIWDGNWEKEDEEQLADEDSGRPAAVWEEVLWDSVKADEVVQVHPSE